MSEEILSEIFERRLSLDGNSGNDLIQDSNRWNAAMSLWQSMSDRLDEIAANTRGGFQRSAADRGKPSASAKQRAHKTVADTKEESSSRQLIIPEGKAEKISAEAVRGGRAATVPTITQKENVTTIAQAGAAPKPTVNATGNTDGTKNTPMPKAVSPVAVHGKATDGGVPAQGKEDSSSAPAKSKSAESLERHRESQLAKEQSNGLVQALKDNLKNWDGSIVTDHGGDAAEAAGLAAGGPVYAAVKEVAHAIGEKTDDENSLAGAIRKTVENKTGITAIKGKVESVKDSARDRILKWANDGQAASRKPEKKGKRDEKGRFIRTDPATKEQLELSEKSVALAEQEAKEEDKRHKELLRAVRGISSDSPLDDLKNLSRLRGGKARVAVGRGVGKAGSKGGRLAKAKAGLGKVLRFGGKAALAGGGLVGAGMLGGGLLDAGAEAVANLGAKGAVPAATSLAARGAIPAAADVFQSAPDLPDTHGKAAAPAQKAGTHAATSLEAEAVHVSSKEAAAGAVKKVPVGKTAAEVASHTVADTGAKAAGKGAGLVAKAGALGSKAAIGAAKALPVIGQALTVGLAIADGVSGWNDEEMHKEAFGLAESQEASTGQKAASAVANVLDMGGLLTGGASLLGFDLDTADIAKGIYGIFGGDDEEKEEKDAATQETSAESTPEQTEMPPTIAWETDDDTSSLFEDLTDSLNDLKDTIADEVEADTAEGGILPQVTGMFSGITSWFSSHSSGTSGRAKEIPGARAQAEAISGKGLGALSERYESGKRGSAAIGYDRKGGTSYGKYQIAAKTGTMDKFLDWAEKNGGEEGREVAARMRSAGPLDTGGKGGRAAQEWQALVSEGKLGNLEHDFIKATHFDPAFAGIKDEGLRKRIEGSKALQDVLWSTSVQHGAAGAQKLINRTYKEGMNDEEFIRALYADRGTQFSSSTGSVQAAVRNRFAQESEVAVAMLSEERKAAPAQAENAAEKQASPAQAEPVVATGAQTTPAAAAQEASSQTATTVAASEQRSIEAVPKPEPLVVESVGQIAPPAGHEKSAMETSGMEKLLKDILVAIQGRNLQKNTPGESNGSPSIGMDFDDATAREFANA